MVNSVLPAEVLPDLFVRFNKPLKFTVELAVLPSQNVAVLPQPGMCQALTHVDDWPQGQAGGTRYAH